VAEAYDRGVDYFDCAPSYFDGEAELKLGEALRPYCSRGLLTEKTMHRDAKLYTKDWSCHGQRCLPEVPWLFLPASNPNS